MFMLVDLGSGIYGVVPIRGRENGREDKVEFSEVCSVKLSSTPSDLGL